ncbi:response regulator [Pedobacter sp. BS3]|uniref:hybrid sensor histidine kinase/response regulator n=1 Tax=Pedobacter sp. BS3 TaxID=2567937 RepID=UPI0011EDE19A|nr:sensor histidine kinase [Pedobacter sp. BS3]TZF81839.1 response regulator [Pedobacter sp. BS3]
MSYKKPLVRLAKGKVIIAFVVSVTALVLAVVISRRTFQKVLSTVENISTPNEKLRLVNKISSDLTRLDQLQRAQVLNKKGSYKAFIKESESLQLTLDSLSDLYKNNTQQAGRIDSMKIILTERDRLFTNYLKVRQGLVNSQVFSDQVKSLSGLIAQGSAQIDSTVSTVEHKTSTTTIIPTRETDTRSLFEKIFGKKKTAVPDSLKKQIVREEINLTVDTLTRAQQDSFTHKIEQLVNQLQHDQNLRRNQFINREIALANVSNELTGQMLTLLQEVQKEVVYQMERNNAQAKSVVNDSVERISFIAILFLVMMAALIYFILTDISRSNLYRKQLEQAKEEAEYHAAAKQRFLSNMSHEIRTPLQSIIGYAELIHNQKHPQRDNIDAIYQSSNHLLHIANEVLDYSRIISGKFTFTPKAFDINLLLQEIVAVLRPQAEKKSLAFTLKTTIPAACSVLYGDAFRLKQVLFNLTGNAIKFTEKGQVTLSAMAKQTGDSADFSFRVTDTGPGIEEKDLKRIFHPFERVDTTTTSGTGLGLAIVQSLVEGQQGTIQVNSRPKHGSVFTVHLAFPISHEPVADTSSSVQQNQFQHKVWVVDDDRFILQLCASILEKYQVNFEAFADGNALLAAPWDNAVKLVLMDMRMPGISGTELNKALRAQIPADVKIVALTAQALPDEREAILQQGFDGLLLKPFKEADLIQLLNNYAQTDNPDELFSIQAFEKMTMGDNEQLLIILQSFIEDCYADIASLQKALADKNAPECSLLMHRLAGRIAQAGYKDLAAGFRELEIKLEHQPVLSQTIADGTQQLTHELEELLAVAEKQLTLLHV